MSLFCIAKVRWCLAIGLLFLCIIPIGCQAVKPSVKPIELQPELVPKITLGPGDVFDIKFFRTPELNETQTVRPDGRITRDTRSASS